MIKAVFFDYDGTLSRDADKDIVEVYIKLLSSYLEPYGYSQEELVKGLSSGFDKTIKNDGSRKNEEVFYEDFKSVLGDKVVRDKPLLDKFYQNEFKELKSVIKDNPLAKEIISFCHKNQLKVVLSTNPLFPYEGAKQRVEFLDLKYEDFDLVTHMENSSFCKPNPLYMTEIMDKLHLKPEEVIYFGNNDYEDGDCAYESGIRKIYLLKEYFIHRIESKRTYPMIEMNDIIPLIKKEIESRQ